MTYDGKERREMSQDSIQRDRLLERLDANVQYLVEGHKNTINALVDHAGKDDARFSRIDETLDDLKKFKWRSTAIVGGVLIAIDILTKFIH